MENYHKQPIHAQMSSVYEHVNKIMSEIINTALTSWGG